MKKCWPLFHDWVVIESNTPSQIRENVLNKINHQDKNNGKPCPPPSRIIAESENRLTKKICLKCETIVDPISPYEIRILIKYYAEKERKRKVEEIMKSLKDTKNRELDDKRINIKD